MLFLNGLSNQEIAQELGVSAVDVEKHLNSLIQRMGVSDQINVLIYAVGYNAQSLFDALENSLEKERVQQNVETR